MKKRPAKMKNKHIFYIRRVNPITGEIKMEKQPHTVLIPPEGVELIVDEKGVIKSKELHGRGNSQVCSGSLCVWNQRDRIAHPVTGVVDFNYGTVHIQSDAEKRQCYGYRHEESWFPKMNDLKGGHDQLLAKIRENGGPISITLRPISRQTAHDRIGEKNGTRPRRKPKHRGAHLRAIVGTYGFGAAYDK